MGAQSVSRSRSRQKVHCTGWLSRLEQRGADSNHLRLSFSPRAREHFPTLFDSSQGVTVKEVRRGSLVVENVFFVRFLLHRVKRLLICRFGFDRSDDESGSHSKFGRMDEDNMQDKERFAR